MVRGAFFALVQVEEKDKEVHTRIGQRQGYKSQKRFVADERRKLQLGSTKPVIQGHINTNCILVLYSTGEDDIEHVRPLQENVGRTWYT